MSSPGNLVLDGDFNFHVNDPSGSTASQFLDLLNCFNLDIVNLCPPTHENSNVLDLIITKSGETSISNLITLQFTAAWPTILALSIQLKVTAKPCFVQLLVFFTVKKINFSLALLQLTSLINSFTSLRRKSSISEVILVHLLPDHDLFRTLHTSSLTCQLANFASTSNTELTDIANNIIMKSCILDPLHFPRARNDGQ